jgi:hypothetical protein
VREVIQFLNAKQKSPTEIHKEVVEVYGENVISRKQVLVWCNYLAVPLHKPSRNESNQIHIIMECEIPSEMTRTIT